MKRSHSSRRHRSKHRGGVAPMPLSYVNPSHAPVDAGEGADRLAVGQHILRPRIAGGSRRRRGGFVPSVMEGFSVAASRYIAPVAMMTMYKMWNHTKGTGSRRRKTRRSRK